MIDPAYQAIIKHKSTKGTVKESLENNDGFYNQGKNSRSMMELSHCQLR